MEILVDAERRVLKYMEPQIACVGLGAELKVETAQQVIMDLHLYRLLVLHMHTLYFKCGRIIKPFLIPQLKKLKEPRILKSSSNRNKKYKERLI